MDFATAPLWNGVPAWIMALWGLIVLLVALATAADGERGWYWPGLLVGVFFGAWIATFVVGVVVGVGYFAVLTAVGTYTAVKEAIQGGVISIILLIGKAIGVLLMVGLVLIAAIGMAESQSSRGGSPRV